MPWCPKCKNEYKKGFQTCNDCNSVLVKTLETKEKKETKESALQAVYFGEEETLTNMVAFLKENGIGSATIALDEKDGLYELFVNRDDVEKAAQMLRTLLQNEQGNPSKEKSESGAQVYEDKYEKAKAYKSSAQVLIAVGVLGGLYLWMRYSDLVSSTLRIKSGSRLSFGVMGIVFVVFVAFGFASLRLAKKVLKEAGADTDLKNEIWQYLRQHATKEILDFGAEENIREEMKDQAQYFERTQKIRDLILQTYPDLNTALLEALVEDWYTELYPE